MELLGDKDMTLRNHWCDQDVPYEHGERTLDTGDSRYVDFAYLDTITYVEVIFQSQHFFSIYLCISTPSMSKTVNMKQRVSRGDFSCPRCIFYYILLLPMSKSKIGAHTGVVLSVSAMYMYYLRCENLPNKNQKQLK